MRVHTQPCWILHLRPWRETSALVELFTRDHGRVGAVVRGIRGPRRQALRAALQPLVPLHADYVVRGELARLGQVDAAGPRVELVGDVLMAAFYVNELVLRLLPRGDPAHAVFLRYGLVLGELERGGPLAWTLRRFERDLLAAIGLGIDFAVDAGGDAVEPDAHYRVDPEHVPERAQGARRGTISGAALLALSDDDCPSARLQAELRVLLRARIARQLGGRPLRSWDLLGLLGRPLAAFDAAPARAGAGSVSAED